MDMETILQADFCAASILISFGAIIGKCSMFQLFTFASIEVCFYALNKAIITEIFKAEDMGGSMIIHVFGAYFGLAATFFY